MNNTDQNRALKARRRNLYQPYGAARELMWRKENEVLLAGPANTGKSRGCLEKVFIAANNYPGMRALIARKTRTSLTQSVLVTWQTKVLPLSPTIRLHTVDQHYAFPNGSKVVVGGMDMASRIMSTEYDLIYVPEATELTEDDWESLTTRLRNGVMPYQQLIADCNPDAPSHWLKKRCDRGTTLMLDSRHEDNPTVTPEYLKKLDDLTGVRYKRLRLGLWAAAEGMVYEGWDRAIHVIDRFEIPGTWPRYWVVDFGYTNPFVFQAWAQDNDGRLYRYKEIYRTGRLVEDHAALILQTMRGEPKPQALICDTDAEDRATLQRHIGIPTIAANKAISPGIQAMAARLRPAGDGKPRMMYMHDSLVERDPLLDEAKKPACTEEEVEGYIWDLSNGRKPAEVPVKKDDHGMDCSRYLVAYVDEIAVPVGGFAGTLDRFGEPVKGGSEVAPSERGVAGTMDRFGNWIPGSNDRVPTWLSPRRKR